MNMGRINFILALSLLIVSIVMIFQRQKYYQHTEESLERVQRLCFEKGKIYYEMAVVIYAIENNNDSVMLTREQLNRINKIADSITIENRNVLKIKLK